MSRAGWFVAAGCAAGVLVSGAALQRAGAGTGPSVIRITDTQTKLVRIDQGRKGHGIGDVEIVRQSLYNRRITRRAIGRADIVCTRMVGGARSCNMTYTLPRGKLVVGGVIGSRLLFEMPVLGGTGLYDNARGSVVVTVSSLKPRREILVFRLVG